MPVFRVTLVFRPSLIEAQDEIYKFIDTAKKYTVNYVVEQPSPQIQYDDAKIVLNGDLKVLKSVLEETIKTHPNVKINLLNSDNLLAHYAVIEEDL
ncbi:hypothetical protein ACFP1I_22215 [Dyadobacter subterraneus]|uniref:Uncharacterized protein n=1 Tax=Dyadobacter subterraneus TaxID=2773304 RepID=A0ABR9WMC5_9BACT|nr:hypothetical protein [Dyadobacter subterraneus]MBE9465516.1 hypothetical protein [Dyadobacter subterraneus]